MRVSPKLTEKDKTLLLTRLEAMSDLYIAVNNSGDGPLSALIHKIKCSQLPLEFDYAEIDRLLRHLTGASKYDRIVLGEDPLRPVLEKIEQSRHSE